jgi:Phage major capsid protein E
MATYIYPTSAQLNSVLQDKVGAQLSQMGDALLRLMPFENVDASQLLWEQRDSYRGLMNVRGLDGQPGRVSRVGVNRYSMDPGVYGDVIQIDETELTIGREPGSLGGPIDLSKTILRRQDQLIDRAINRLRQISAKLLIEGTFTVTSEDGQVKHTDTFSIQTQDAAVEWSEHATATPLADLRTLALKARGHSVVFDHRATLLMNRVTFNHLIANTNTDDLGRYRADYSTGLIPLRIDTANTILAAENLPKIEIYDEGYLDAAGTFVPFIADGKVAAIGHRMNGEPVAEFLFTRNANNPGAAPGMYTKVVDRGESQVPRQIEVHMGFNGGPAIYFPSAIVKLNVA